MLKTVVACEGIDAYEFHDTYNQVWRFGREFTEDLCKSELCKNKWIKTAICSLAAAIETTCTNILQRGSGFDTNSMAFGYYSQCIIWISHKEMSIASKAAPLVWCLDLPYGDFENILREISGALLAISFLEPAKNREPVDCICPSSPASEHKTEVSIHMEGARPDPEVTVSIIDTEDDVPDRWLLGITVNCGNITSEYFINELSRVPKQAWYEFLDGKTLDIYPIGFPQCEWIYTHPSESEPFMVLREDFSCFKKLCKPCSVDVYQHATNFEITIPSRILGPKLRVAIDEVYRLIESKKP